MPRNKSEKNTPLKACAAAYAAWLPQWKIFRGDGSNRAAEMNTWSAYDGARAALSNPERRRWNSLSDIQRSELYASQ